jgi:hypothetical protein
MDEDHGNEQYLIIRSSIVGRSVFVSLRASSFVRLWRVMIGFNERPSPGESLCSSFRAPFDAVFAFKSRKQSGLLSNGPPAG